MKTIQQYQQDCWKNYKNIEGLPAKYSYLYGNPVKVQVPVDVAAGGLMIVGAYPTAQFNTINGINDVPVADHLYPFSNDTYFDGSRVRQVRSGEELEDNILKKIGYPRSQCWITDLVKVFLFKEGHIKKYIQVGYGGFSPTRNKFKEMAKASLGYFYEEVELANPKVILLLGQEVTSVVMNMSLQNANLLLQFEMQKIIIGEKQYKIIGCPHPGILMRGGENGNKWRKISEDQLEMLKKYL